MTACQDAGAEACQDPRRGYALPNSHPLEARVGYVIVAYGPRVECYDALPAATVRGHHHVRARVSRGGSLVPETCGGKSNPGSRC